MTFTVSIAPDKEHFLNQTRLIFQLKSTDTFHIQPRKHMLWVLIRNASMTHFERGPQHKLLWKNKKITGPRYLKLTMLLVNVSLKL